MAAATIVVDLEPLLRAAGRARAAPQSSAIERRGRRGHAYSVMGCNSLRRTLSWPQNSVQRTETKGAGDGRRIAIRAEGLVKRYGEATGARRVRPRRRAGTVCGLLGPNGAGKTTAVRILATLLRPDGGRAEVAGADVAAAPHEVRRRIGLSGQEPAVDEILSGRQNLVLFGRLNRLGKAAAERRADELLEQFGLADAGGQVGEALLGRHAPPARPGRHAAAGARGAVPRRAHDRARPPQPQRGVGGDPGARGRRHHRAAHHPVPRRGRPARRPGGGDRRRPGHRRRHARAAEGPGRRRPARRGRRRGPPTLAGGRRASLARVATAEPEVEADADASARPSPTGSPRSPRSSAASPTPASRSPTSACAGRRSTTCSCTSPATGPSRPNPRRSPHDRDDDRPAGARPRAARAAPVGRCATAGSSPSGTWPSGSASPR